MSHFPLNSTGPAMTGRIRDGYRRAFEVLEHCEPAITVDDFAERLLESMSSAFNIRYVTFFLGESLDKANFDRKALITGGSSGRRMMAEYTNDWRRSDPFSTSGPQQQLLLTGVASLCEGYSLPSSSRIYVKSFLQRRNLESGTAMSLTLANKTTVLVGLFDPSPNAVTLEDLPLLRKLQRQLGVLSRSLKVMDETPLSLQLAQVSSRQRDVATLVAEGLTNAAIGERLTLTEDTVKKYVSKLLAVTGYSCRTELALAVQQQTAR